MAVFEYEGLDAQGRSARGIVDAEGLRAARAKLKRQGVFATRLEETRRAVNGSPEGAVPWFGRGIRTGELSLITRQLATLLGAGLPLVAALGALLEQVESERVRRVLSQVREGVNEGKAFHEALADQGRSFPDIFRNMVSAGEASGTLPLVLARLADFLEGSMVFRRKVQSALVYPILMGFLGTGILWFLLASVVPRVTRIFEDVQRALPLPTRVLLATSAALRSYGWIALVMLALGLLALNRYSKTPEGRLHLHGLVLKLPAFGRFRRLVAVSRFAKTLGTLLGSGVPLLTSLDIARAVLGNAVLEDAVADARIEVREGRSLRDALRASGQFPAAVVQMVGVGEESGALDQMLLKVAEAFEAQVEAAVVTLTSLLEPLMILAMGLAVGFVVLAVLLPIFEMSQFAG
ncbi:MAG: type II secretion system inner membrane protein GspF [Deltaproteobacteria bacterium]|nr:type II secretion system inner membrane protein GspF [Deltaproteobacteria bacterium]